MFDPLLHRLQELCLPTGTATMSRRYLRMMPAWLVESLPALGTVLYVPMRPVGSTHGEMSRGVLVEALQLAPLLQVRWLVVVSMITVEGPREWIECMDRHGHACARLHLLPDTDYLAWDALLASGESIPAAKLAPWPQSSRATSAQLLRFHARRLAGLVVLGGEVTTQVSSLSTHLAVQIARAEAVSLRLAAHG